MTAIQFIFVKMVIRSRRSAQDKPHFIVQNYTNFDPFSPGIKIKMNVKPWDRIKRV